MFGPAPHQPPSSQVRTRALSQRTQMMARGPGWRLAEGEGMSWHIRLGAELSDPVLTWAHILRTLRGLADSTGLRPLVIDLRDTPRLYGTAADAAALVFALYEAAGLRVATISGHDLILALRVHRLLALNAPSQGQGSLDAAEAFDWARRGAPPIAPPQGLALARRSAPRV